MKLPILNKGKEKKSEVEMPSQFNEVLRKDIIKRAVEAEQSNNRQKYGAYKKAGKRHSSFLSKRRSDYKSTYGIGQSRTPRKVMSRSGTRMNFVGATAPMTVGGRRAHPPKAEKNWDKKVNTKEMLIALRSAMAATLNTELVTKRGHKMPEGYPFIVDSAIEAVKKTKEAKDFLASLGLDKDLKRAQVKKVRPGKGTMRGRKYKKKKSVLIVVAKECDLLKAAKNIPGIDVTTVNDLQIEELAPGGVSGRMTLWSSKAIDKISKEKMFI